MARNDFMPRFTITATSFLFMPYGRRYYRPRVVNRDKYSIEQSAGEISTTGEGVIDAVADIVPSADLQGMRKVKHITLSLSGTYSSSSTNSVIYWAIVYVPAGTTPNALNVNGQALYEPNQFVMNCGIMDADAGPNRISSPVSRNLNSGDKICLIIKAPNNSFYKYVAKYAVTLQ